MRCFFAAVLILGCVCTLNADPIRVVATGDSLTLGYDSHLSSAFQNLGISANVPILNYDDVGAAATARGGMWANWYVGHDPYPNEFSPINYAANVLTANPDVIMFMLGTNDAAQDWDNATVFNNYKNYLDPVFANFAAFQNSSEKHPQVIIGSILPRLPGSGDPGFSSRIQNDYNPWLQAEASKYGFTFLDNWSAMQQIPNWQNDIIDPVNGYGVHLTDAGYDWLAGQFAGAVVVPEPSTMVLLSFGVFGLLALARRRSR